MNHKIKILEAKLNDKDRTIKCLIEELEKNKKEIFLKQKNNKLNLNVIDDDISNSYFKKHKFNDLFNAVLDSDIEELYPFLESFDKKQIFANCEKEVFNIFNLEFDVFSGKINERIIEMTKEFNILISETEKKCETITNALSGSNIPRNIIDESTRPLLNHISSMKEKVERLEKLKYQFMDIAENKNDNKNTFMN